MALIKSVIKNKFETDMELKSTLQSDVYNWGLWESENNGKRETDFGHIAAQQILPYARPVLLQIIRSGDLFVS